MKFSSTIAVLALGASAVSALPKAQAVDDPEAVVELDPFADDPPVVEDPIPIVDPVLDDPFPVDPIPEEPPVEDPPVDVGGPTGIPIDTGGNGAIPIDIIEDPIPLECPDQQCPTGWVLGNYWYGNRWHHGWHPTFQIDSGNDNSVDNSQYPDNSVDNSKLLSPDLNLTDTDNSRTKSPDVANGVGNGNGNGNGANVTQDNDQNVAVAVDASPAINIYNADGSINEEAIKESQDHKDHHGYSWPKNGTYTEIVSVLTTYCPEPTTIHQNGKDYPVHTAGYVTITDCPCTVVHVRLSLPPLLLSSSPFTYTHPNFPPLHRKPQRYLLHHP
jgi:hypothetical protein